MTELQRAVEAYRAKADQNQNPTNLKEIKTMTPLHELKSIEMTHTTTDGQTIKTMLTFKQFNTSFVEERWRGERRTQSDMTIFGYYHHKTTCTSPTGEKSVRVFSFPKSREEAEARHKEATA